MEEAERSAGVGDHRDGDPAASEVQARADATGIIEPATASDPGRVPVSMAKPTTWILVVGGVMTLGWLLFILNAATGGADITGFLLMCVAAIWWRMKTGRQLGSKSSAWLKNVVDQRTANKVSKSHFDEAVDRAVGGPGPMHAHDLDRTGAKVGGFMLKRVLMLGAGAALCFVRPVLAGVGELRILLASR
jgi:hypothetical protein